MFRSYDLPHAEIYLLYYIKYIYTRNRMQTSKIKKRIEMARTQSLLLSMDLPGNYETVVQWVLQVMLPSACSFIVEHQTDKQHEKTSR
jgi:hypothetical protein